MGHLAQPQNPSGLITAPVQPPSSLPPPLLSSPPSFSPHPQPFFPFLFHPSMQSAPCGVQLPCSACWNIHHTLRERERERERPSQLAALTLIDLAPMLTQTPRETLQRRRHGGVWECILQGGMRGWYGGTLKLTAGQSVFLSVCLCVCLSGETPQTTSSTFCCVYSYGSASSVYVPCVYRTTKPIPHYLFFFFSLGKQQSLRLWFHYAVRFSPWRLRAISVIDGHSVESRGTDRDKAAQPCTWF